MRWWKILTLRFRSLFRQGSADRELAAELQFHLDALDAENRAAGMTPPAARAAALRAMGGMDQATEACRDVRRVSLLHDLARDARYAVRVLRRSPSFSVVAVLTLALGIGATTAIFSVLDAVVLRPLPYPDADRLVAIGTRAANTGRETPRLTGGDLLDIEAGGLPFAAFSWYWGGELGAQVDGAGQFAGVFWVEPAFFDVFGVTAVAGRTFGRADGTQAAVIGHGLAERLFGSADRALGKPVSVEGQAYEIAGVLPQGFEAPRKTDLWLPAPPLPSIARNRTAFNFLAVARLAHGVSLADARSGLAALGARLAAADPETNRDRTFTVTPLGDRLAAPVRATLYLLMGAVSLVLLIACVNVASLLLARATTRSHEIALRGALGAGRWRLVRQLLAESVVLALPGGAMGLALAWLGTNALVHLAPAGLPRLDEVGMDGRILVFAGACSLLASLVFGLAPAWQAARADVQEGLKQAAPRGVIGGRSMTVRNLLVVGEIALAFSLAVGAALFGRSFIGLAQRDLGFRPDSVLVMSAHRPASGRAEYVEVARFFSEIAPRLSGIPGVTAVGATMGLPTGQYGSNGSYRVEGRHAGTEAQRLPEAGFRLASPGYFAALGIPLVRGRDFQASDTIDAPFVAIVSRALARETFPGEDPIGRRLECGLDAPGKWMTIVGVVGDVRQDSPGAEPGPELYMPLPQHPYHANEVQVVVRTTVPPASLAGAVRERMRAAAPGTALKFTTLDDMVATSIDTPRFRAFLIGLFAALAVLLAIAGVYGVTTYLTAQRTAEFGLRVALGAGRREVFTLVLTRAARLAAAGLALGVVLSVASGRLISSMLVGLTPLDGPTYGLVLVLLAGVVLAAAAVPAWRAASVDPVTALRD